LEGKHDGPAQAGTLSSQQLGRGEKDRDVPIVPAGVVHAIACRAVRLAAVGLEQRQCVHVGTQQHTPTWSPAAQNADNTGPPDPSAHLVQIELAQSIGYQTGRAVFLVCHLGVAVQIAPPLDQLRPLRVAEHVR
jgi:hypothetical protein